MFRKFTVQKNKTKVFCRSSLESAHVVHENPHPYIYIYIHIYTYIYIYIYIYVYITLVGYSQSSSNDSHGSATIFVRVGTSLCTHLLSVQ